MWTYVETLKGFYYFVAIFLVYTAQKVHAVENDEIAKETNNKPFKVITFVPPKNDYTTPSIITTASTIMSHNYNNHTENINEFRKTCFHVEPDLCLTANQIFSNDTNQHNKILNRDNNCHCHSHPIHQKSWYCCNISDVTMISSFSDITNLHIYNLTTNEFNLSNPIFRTLHSLAITDGNIKYVIGRFPRLSTIKCLNVSNNNISYIQPRAFIHVPNLKFLDISNNNLSQIPNWNQNQNITVNVSGNKRMFCQPLLEAIFSNSFKFINADTSFCLLNYTYSWFNTTDYVTIKQLDAVRRFGSECPRIQGHGSCKCTPEQRLIVVDQSKPTPKLFCHVDCSGLKLTELPSALPENTFSLNISNNNITNIDKHFQNNPSYQSIVKLYADNNQIKSMHELEGTKFMDNFQRLYLRNNDLTKIPEYLLTNVLDSIVGRHIFLGGNKLQCDCNSAKVLKLWLLERNRDIPDYNEILCRNLPQKVIELQEIKVCQSPHDWTDYIYYLIAAEFLLLLSLIAKVSYDYWVFKTAGYLPWPASKMPKLPCDWLCES